MKRVPVALTIGALLAGALFQAVVAATIVESGDMNRDGYYDYWGIDDNGDGIIDRTLLDFGNDGRAEVEMQGQGSVLYTALIDTNFDAVWDTALQPAWVNGSVTGWTSWRDWDQNGRWENAYFDGNNDRYAEWVMVDSNFDGAADTWQANSVPAGYTATDVIARDVGAMVAFDNLVKFGVPIFGPLAWPVGG